MVQLDARPLRILALTHCDAAEGCTFARIITPLRALEAMGEITYRQVRIVPWSGVAFRRILRDLTRWDVLWVARPRHYLMLPLIREARRAGVPVLVDIDDWLVEQPDAHNAAQWAGTRTSQETMRAALRDADAITVSTPILAERCAELGLRAHVVPNAVDCTQFTRQPRDEGPVTVGFGGSMAHLDDVPLVAPGLLSLLRERPDRARVVSIGCPIPQLEGMVRYTYMAAVAATDYPRVLSDLRIDIGLAPLQDTPFNRAKSDIKYLEYSATGAATIASPVAPYSDSVRADRGIVVNPNTADAWADAMRSLVDDPLLRERLAAGAYEWVRGERSIEAMAHKWLAIFHEYVNGRQRAAAPNARNNGHITRMLEHVVLRQIPYYGQEFPRLVMHRVRTRARKHFRPA